MTAPLPASALLTDLDTHMLELIADVLSIPGPDVRASSRFVTDLGADSLDVVELIMAVEDEFGLEVPDEDADKLITVAMAIDYVRGRLSASGGRFKGSRLASESGQRTAELHSLTDLELNWVVARLLGRNDVFSAMHGCYGEIDPTDSIALDPLPDYCTNWAVGGPLVERFNAAFTPVRDSSGVVTAWTSRTCPRLGVEHGEATDSRQLRAAMLAIVNQHCGGRVEVPASMETCDD